ncbi:hypothetical protein D3C74_153840 [compost metagenome]
MLFQYIREHHRIRGEEHMGRQTINFTDSINDWIEETWAKQHVNILLFVDDWIDGYSENESLWP